MRRRRYTFESLAFGAIGGNESLQDRPPEDCGHRAVRRITDGLPAGVNTSPLTGDVREPGVSM
jgi:hypothetical protein